MRRQVSVILEIGNHAKVRDALAEFCSAGDLDFFDEAVAQQVRAWLRLAEKHLTVARRLEQERWADWRSVVSRAYYAAYTASRAVRYYVHGKYDSSGADHKKASGLPDDFPNRDQWKYWLTELHDDRNKADYDPDAATYYKLANDPSAVVSEAREFVSIANDYLAGRGL